MSKRNVRSVRSKERPKWVEICTIIGGIAAAAALIFGIYVYYRPNTKSNTESQAAEEQTVQTTRVENSNVAELNVYNAPVNSTNHSITTNQYNFGPGPARQSANVAPQQTPEYRQAVPSRVSVFPNSEISQPSKQISPPVNTSEQLRSGEDSMARVYLQQIANLQNEAERISDEASTVEECQILFDAWKKKCPPVLRQASNYLNSKYDSTKYFDKDFAVFIAAMPDSFNSERGFRQCKNVLHVSAMELGNYRLDTESIIRDKRLAIK
ncbi:MAG TPA: hypothetical protein VF528_05990 [Pyrinomonadaceae bacterium]|jgi:hypothetical protein